MSTNILHICLLILHDPGTASSEPSSSGRLGVTCLTYIVTTNALGGIWGLLICFVVRPGIFSLQFRLILIIIVYSVACYLSNVYLATRIILISLCFLSHGRYLLQLYIVYHAYHFLGLFYHDLARMWKIINSDVICYVIGGN